MKKFFLLTAVLLCLFSCSTSESDDEKEPTPEFAMTAEINGELFQANTPFGDNEFSDYTIWNRYPTEEYILLQARKGYEWDTLTEINIWLKKSDIAVGTYAIGKETFEEKPSHYIGFVHPSSEDPTDTKEGTIVITDVNTSAKTVQGTFEFTTVAELYDDSATPNYTITNGKFYYTYE
ncbi:DUF6252 family protein [Salinimicrobium gaetbulicola]|uniref:DUF6252 family protein n=1 Tax=Salinimicrobium gaetbulicola TaxID=999702 RepID=A0ABW3IEW1_9FLAO